MKLFVGILLLFLTLCLADDSLFEPGTPENPKEDLPYNDDVMVKTLVRLLSQIEYSICLKTVPTWLWMVILWEYTTLFPISCILKHRGICTEMERNSIHLLIVTVFSL